MVLSLLFGRKPKMPKPIDVAATAKAQGEANREAIRESAKVSAVDQHTPWGNVTYTRDGSGFDNSLEPNEKQGRQTRRWPVLTSCWIDASTRK